MKNTHDIAATAEQASPDLIDNLLNSIPRAEISPTFAIGVLFGIGVILLIGMLWLHLSGPREKRGLPPGDFKPKALLTNNEIEFYGRLVTSLPGYVVLAQVSMGAVLDPRTTDPKEYMHKRMMFSQKIIDFVICYPGDLEILAIVELDDVTHDPEKDAKRDKMLASAGYNLIRWHSRSKPDRATIAKTIRKLDTGRKSIE